MLKIDNSVFENWTKIDHPIIKEYKPLFLDRGEENIVYTLTDRSDIVIKINIDSIIESLQWKDSEEDLHSRLQETAECEKERFTVVEEVYGNDHVPKTDFKILKIPINNEVISELYKIKQIDSIGESTVRAPAEILAIVLIQEKIESLDNPERRFIPGQYSERYELPVKVYSDITNKLVFKLDTGFISVDDFILVQDIRRNHMYPLFRLLKNTDTDAQLAVVVKDFILKTKTYIDRTDSILDLAGRMNFAFLPIQSQDRKIWNYKILDILYPRKEYKLSLMREKIQRYISSEKEEGEEEDLILNEDVLLTVNFIRVMNGLSDIFGLGRIFNQLDGLNTNPETLYTILHSKIGLTAEQSKIAVFDPPKV